MARPWRPTPLVAASVAFHGAGLGALALQPAVAPWVLGAWVANHVVLATSGMTPRSSLLGANRTRLVDGAGQVGLSFDDGPDPAVTPAVLDLLDRYRARASFFLIGERVARHPELAAEICRRGHRVENHTWSHPAFFCCLGPGGARRQLLATNEIIATTTGVQPSQFRPPAGLRQPWLEPVLADLDLDLVSWTRRGFDTADGRPERVQRRVTEGLGAGEIVLLHDGNAARTASGRPVVLEVLPRVLETLAAKGWSAVAT
ncbi:MAG: polysaccharide deacetylase family protein [Thermoanaerobaculia bacterium]|nr:polysaccharide deacetylase family protein [Thermoanaerobaculia bacterium]